MSRPNEYFFIVVRLNVAYNISHELGVYKSYACAKNKVKKDKLKVDSDCDVCWIIYVYQYQKILVYD